jgi:hypothetical protein
MSEETKKKFKEFKIKDIINKNYFDEYLKIEKITVKNQR